MIEGIKGIQNFFFDESKKEEVGTGKTGITAKNIYNFPSQTTSKIIKINTSINGYSGSTSATISNSATVGMPDEGWIELPYSIDYIKDGNVREWESTIGIHLDDISSDSINKADGTNFNNLFVKIQQTNRLYNATVSTWEGDQEEKGQTVNGNFEDIVYVIDTGILAASEVWKIDAGSVITVDKVEVAYYLRPYAGTMTVQFQYSSNGVDWFNMESSQSTGNTSGTDGARKLTDIEFRYLRALLTVSSNGEFGIYDAVAYN